MEAIAYRLEARAPFHLGLRGVGVEESGVYAPADTLFSGLCHTLQQLYSVTTLEAWLKTYTTGEPAVVLSSAFPYLVGRDGTVLRLWPRPNAQPPGLVIDPSQRKAAKRIAWVSESVWRAWVGGEALAAYWPRQDVAGTWGLTEGGVWVSDAEGATLGTGRPWAVGDAPRVTVDRLSGASAVYQAGRVQFAQGGGLWFVARWSTEEHQRLGEQALAALGDAGLGGERSSGHGLFTVAETACIALPAAPLAARCTILSPYYPRHQQELDSSLGGGVSYQLQVRRGWMSSPYVGRRADGRPVSGGALRRKAVRLFREGSLLMASAECGYMGGLADVAPDVFHAHRVVRYGCALLAGYQPQGEPYHA